MSSLVDLLGATSSMDEKEVQSNPLPPATTNLSFNMTDPVAAKLLASFLF